MALRDTKQWLLLLIFIGLASLIKQFDSMEASDAMWKKKEPEHSFPVVQFNTGYDTDGTPLFAARAKIYRGLNIGYVRKGATYAHFAVSSYEKTEKYYEVMVSATGHWEKQPDKQIPANAIRVGNGNEGSLYLGRVHYKGALYPAQVSASSKKASFIHDGQQVDSAIYEILVSNWIRHLKGGMPQNAFKFAKNQKTGDSFYLVRANHRGKLYPGVLTNGETGALIQTEKKPLRVHVYEVLTGIYHIRDSHFIANQYPVVLGQDAHTYYVCLALVNGEMIPGRLSTKKHSRCKVYKDGAGFYAKQFYYLKMCE